VLELAVEQACGYVADVVETGEPAGHHLLRWHAECVCDLLCTDLAHPAVEDREVSELEDLRERPDWHPIVVSVPEVLDELLIGTRLAIADSPEPLHMLARCWVADVGASGSECRHEARRVLVGEGGCGARSPRPGVPRMHGTDTDIR